MVSAAQSSSRENIPPGPSRCWSARNKKLERIQLRKNVLGEVSKTVNNKEDFEVLMSVDSAVKENNPYWRRFSVFLFVYVPVCKWVGGGGSTVVHDVNNNHLHLISSPQSRLTSQWSAIIVTVPLFPILSLLHLRHRDEEHHDQSSLSGEQRCEWKDFLEMKR